MASTFEHWVESIAADVEKKGFVDAFVEHYEDILRAQATKLFGSGITAELIHRWMRKDPKLAKTLDELEGEAKAALERLLDGTDAVPETHNLLAELREQIREHGYAHPEIREGDGEPMTCLRDALFQNWGRTVENTPALTCLPTTKAGVCNIVKWAKRQGKTVRASGYRHTWGDLYSNQGQVLLSLLPLDVVNKLPASEPLLNSANELMGIEMVGEVVEDGVTKGLCKIGAATTNEMFRRWAIGTMAWTVPLNVIMVEISWGGSNAPICHGAGLRHQTLSDLVHAVEFVNPKGELQVVDDPEQLAAASGCFGMLGIVTSVTLKLEAMSFAALRPRKIAAELAVPPLPETKVPPALQPSTPYTPEQLAAAKADFVRRAEEDYYSEWFWFVEQKQCWVNTWTNDGTYADAIDYPKPLSVGLQNAEEYLAELLNQFFARVPLLADLIQAKLMATTAMLVLPDVGEDGDPIVTPVIDGLHFRRGIQNMRVLDMEFEIPIPADAAGKPDWSICQRAWWDVIELYYTELISPLRLTMEMRIMGGSQVTMAPQYGNDLGTCSIEVLTPFNVAAEDWLGFMQKVVDRWQTYTDASGAPLNIRPHWAKQWQGLKVRDKDVVSYLRDEAYAEQIPEFGQGLAAVAEAGGYTIADLKMFTNPLLLEVFAPIFAT